jgi:hypothetical protein
MILEYFEAHQRYSELSEETLSVCRKVSPSEYITPHRLSACSADFLGSATSAFEAYQRYLPWILDDQHEMNLQFNRDDFSPELAELNYNAFTQPNELSDAEAQRVQEYQARSHDRVMQMVERSKKKKSTNFDGAMRADEQRFVSSFKSFLFFCRSLQDEIYGTVLLISDQTPGSARSMNNAFSNEALKDRHPVAAVLKHVDGYPEWYFRMRSKRNQVKDGAGASILGPLPNIGIGLQSMSRDGAQSTNVNDGFRFSDITSSLRFSANVLEASIKP